MEQEVNQVATTTARQRREARPGRRAGRGRVSR